MPYSYDYLSRLSTSTFHNYSDACVISGINNYNENLAYDLRGNIQTLQRTGYYTNGSTCTYGQIDNLTYSYTANTNRLHKVLDGTVTAGDAKSRGFNGNLSTIDNSMTYDRNGNLNKNLHKNVSTITYNHLNLPTVITFTTGNTIEFLYDATAGTSLPAGASVPASPLVQVWLLVEKAGVSSRWHKSFANLTYSKSTKNSALPLVQVSRLVPVSARLLTCVIK